MYNGSGNFSFPKLTDLFNVSDIEHVNWLGFTTSLWVAVFGNWFFAMVIGVIGAGVYIKYENATVAAVYFIVMGILFGAVLPFLFLTLIGLIGGFTVGILLYQVFISKEE